MTHNNKIKAIIAGHDPHISNMTSYVPIILKIIIPPCAQNDGYNLAEYLLKIDS